MNTLFTLNGSGQSDLHTEIEQRPMNVGLDRYHSYWVTGHRDHVHDLDAHQLFTSAADFTREILNKAKSPDAILAILRQRHLVRFRAQIVDVKCLFRNL